MKIILVAAFLTVGLSSCFEKDLYEPTIDGENKPENLDDFFGFNTTKDVQMNVKYNVPQGYSVSFEVYDVNPLSLDENGQIVKQKGLTSVGLGSTDENGNFSETLSVPATLNQVYIYSSAAGVRTVMQARIASGVIPAFSVNEDNDENLVNWEESTNVRANATFSNSKEVLERGSLLTLGSDNAITWKPKGGEPLNYNESETKKFETIQSSVLTAVDAVLKENQTPVGLAMGDDYKTDLITKDGKVYIRYVSGKSSSMGTLAYYCYPADANLTKDYIDKLPKCLVFANTMDESWDPSNTSLKRGLCVELKYIKDGRVTNEPFPVKTRIGFVLYNNGYKKGFGSSNSLFNLSEPFYSTPIKGVARFGYTATFTYRDKEHGDLVLMGFEDWTDAADYNDFVFNVTGVEGTTFREEDVTTIDGALTRGTLAFEDNWPNEGDYDMNDLIVKYASQPSYTRTTYLGTSKVTYSKDKIVDTFTLAWAGAGYKNGFGYKVNLGDDVKEIVVERNGQKVDSPIIESEEDGSQVILLFKDARAELNLGDQTPLDMAGKNVTPVTYVVTTKYTKGESSQIPVFKCKAPYNPFIFVNTNRAHEIHLIDNTPTSKMRQDLWGKEADASVPGSGEYYRNKEYWPFAINVDASGNNNAAWDVNKKLSAVETVQIDKSYPDFIKWANSKGADYTTWWDK